MRELKAKCGSFITNFCQELVDCANVYNEQACGDFNDIHLVANPGDSAASLEEYFNTTCDTRHEEYISSPEYKKRQEEYAEKERKRQATLSLLLATCPSEPTFCWFSPIYI